MKPVTFFLMDGILLPHTPRLLQVASVCSVCSEDMTPPCRCRAGEVSPYTLQTLVMDGGSVEQQQHAVSCVVYCTVLYCTLYTGYTPTVLPRTIANTRATGTKSQEILSLLL